MTSLLHDNAVTTLFSSPSQFDEFMFSRILTLDLQPYPLVEEDNGKQTDKEVHRVDRRQDSYSLGSTV